MRLSPPELRARAAEARTHYADCDLCPHDCRVDRTHGPAGRCREGDGLWLAGAGVHFGEEPPLVGSGGNGRPGARHGSGLILIGGCNLDCAACETADLSLERRGLVATTPAALGALCCRLEEQGAANLNFVTPTHVLPALVEGLAEAAERGCRLPVVWNCGGYESLAALRLLDGVVDLYLPDAKSADEVLSGPLLGAPGYFAALGPALAEMHRQVGDLEVGPDGLADRGLLVRHLVLPGGLGDPGAIFRLCASLSRDLCVNLMTQYRPLHRAAGLTSLPTLRRRPSRAEALACLHAARTAGLRRVLLDGRPAGDRGLDR